MSAEPSELVLDADGEPLSKKALKRLQRKKEMEEKKRLGIKPKTSKAERRALQEKQRAAKTTEGEKKVRKNSMVHKPAPQFDNPKRMAKYSKKQMVERVQIPDHKKVDLFQHILQYEREDSLTTKVGVSKEEIHPAVLRLGFKYSEGTIQGSNARCVAMLRAFMEWIKDYTPDQGKAIARDLDLKIRPLVRYLKDCRATSTSMGNAVRFLKAQFGNIDPESAMEDVKQWLCQQLEEFIHIKITMADQLIIQYALNKIEDGDVICVFAKSHVVEHILAAAHAQGRRFRVVVVDSRPKNEGVELMERLASRGIECSYCLLNALSYVLQEVTKVLLGAHSVHSNGTVQSRVGTSVVAMMAHTHGIPVLVCCETYKFHESVQLDSICKNELGDPDDLMYLSGGSVGPLGEWRDLTHLKLLNLVYDVTPAEFVTMLVTEVGCLPTSSVPALLREYREEKSRKLAFLNTRRNL